MEAERAGNGSTRKRSWKSRASIALIKGALRIPGIDRVNPWLRKDKSEFRWLPINADISMPADTPRRVSGTAAVLLHTELFSKTRL